MTAHLWGYQPINRPASNQRVVLASPPQASGGAVRTPVQLARVGLLGVVLLLVGCAGADIDVPSTRLPVPVVDRLPINVGIHLSDDLRSYAHEETIKDFGTFRISVGPAQQLMFDNLATGLFAQHRFVTPENPAGNDLDAVLVPTIEELQFSIPEQTKSDFFEVWVRYNFQFISPNGAMIAQWPMQAYGRANSRNYGFLEDTENAALQEASRVALRDAMAVFTFKFPRVARVNQWLANGKVMTTAAAEPQADASETGLQIPAAPAPSTNSSPGEK